MRFLLTIVLVFFVAVTVAQKTYTYNDQVWLSYFNQSRISKKWGIWFDASLRTRNQLVHHFSQGIVRAGATRIINENRRFTAGYAYMHHFANSAHPLTDRPEHRPFEMIQWQKQFNNWRVVQTGRLEQRFRHRIKDGDLGEGYNFNYRARYALAVTRALSEHSFEAGSVSLQFGGELFGNFGKEIVHNQFDQLRLKAGFNYHVYNPTVFNLGYFVQVKRVDK